MKKSITVFLTAMIASATIGAVDPATLPTTTQASVTIKPTDPYTFLHGMSRDYVILTSRSIFKKGEQDVDPSVDINTVPPQDPPKPRSYVSETSIEFNGATHADNTWAAFFENTSSHDVSIRHVGDDIAQGKIVGMTLDSVDYQVNGRQSTIMLGQTLDGSAGPELASAPSVSMSSTQPSGGAFTGPMADVLERLRQKRMKELGQ